MSHKQRVVLIDDEYLARDELQDSLRRRHADIVGAVEQAATAREGWALIEKGGVDGVFLDINFQTESRRAGMDLACLINNLAEPPWIVFASGHPEFALEAHDVDPAHFLEKPLSDTKVDKAMERVRRRCQCRPPGPPGVIEIQHSAGKRLLVEYIDPRAEILYVRTLPNSDALRVHLLGCRDLRVAGPLRHFAERLAPYGFVSIHKGVLVNRAFRGRLQPDPVRDECHELALKGGCPDRLPVRRYFQWDGG